MKIKWQKAKFPLGKNLQSEGYRSHDGRWSIVKTSRASSRNGYWKTAWHLFDGDKKVLSLVDTCQECKEFAEIES